MSDHIWRYMNLSQFVHMMLTNTLHFTRIDQFKDKFEGSYPLKNIEDWQNKYPEVGDFRHWRKFACVSCWHESDREDTAMWERYGIDGQGLAICSTKKRLERSLKCDELSFENIQYIDFVRSRAEINFPYDAFRYKRSEFECECEFRAILFKLPSNAGFENGIPMFGSVENQGGFPEVGVSIDIDLQLLVEKVVLSPSSQNWYRDILKDLVSRYDLRCLEIAQSDLSVDPVYPKQ